jgi:hypothetical protein
MATVNVSGVRILHIHNNRRFIQSVANHVVMLQVQDGRVIHVDRCRIYNNAN